MIISIKNEHLSVSFSTKGAELQSIKGNDSQINYLWNGDQKFWGKFSPILFPIVGALKENVYEYQDKKYTLPRHGFARELDFEYTQLDETEITFKLSHSEETLKSYPFAFELGIHYQLKGASLTCTYQVFNPASKDLLFSIGGHPAFAAPLNNEGDYTDYYLQFDQDDSLTYSHIAANLLTNDTTTISLRDKILPLKHELFYDDALVFKAMKSNNIRLLNNKNYKGVNFRFENFPYFGIWAAKDADFVCLEPWCGIADSVNHNQKLEEKEGIVKLKAEQSWQRSWEISCF